VSANLESPINWPTRIESCAILRRWLTGSCRGVADGVVIDSHTPFNTLAPVNIPLPDNHSLAPRSGFAFAMCTIDTLDPHDRSHATWGSPVGRDATR
jgi:hypothetical protein